MRRRVQQTEDPPTEHPRSRSVLEIAFFGLSLPIAVLTRGVVSVFGLAIDWWAST
jgi:hypothetical protein